MAGKLNVITGATGLLGSHVAEQLATRGERVRALVRPSSDVSFLRGLGVELAQGDLADAPSLHRAFAGADVVYHCAAKVGEWGPWSEYQALIIDATRNVVDACRTASVGRLLHVSSIAVYGHLKAQPGRLFAEDEPLGQNLWLWDNYTRAKIAAEELVRQYAGAWTMVRPSWIYGPRDRTSLPRVLKAIQAGRVSLVGSGDNLLNIVYAGDVARGAVLAAEHPGAVGQAYNLSSAGEITQRDFLNALTDLLGLPRITRRFPFPLVFALGFFSELIGHLIRIKRPPHITRYAVALVGRPTQFSVAKAARELGWRPEMPAHEGLRRTLDWYRATQSGGPASVRAGSQ